jgi:hypothetical protein
MRWIAFALLLWPALAPAQTCTRDADCAGTPATPACSPNGVCQQCSALNHSRCTLALPVCDLASGTCVKCSATNGGEATCRERFGRHCDATHANASIQGTCVQCRGDRAQAQSDCTSATASVCNATTDTCGACAAPGDCVQLGAGFACSAGRCTGCTANTDCALPAAPRCATSACSACTSDTDCARFAAAGAPACQIGAAALWPGECRHCSLSNTNACVGATPACNYQSGLCQVCTVAFGDLGGVSTGCALNPNGIACQGSGPSVFCGCDDDSHCGRNLADPAKSGRICNPTTRKCIDGCSRAAGRNDCPAGQFCTAMGNGTGVCTMTCNFDVDCAAMAGMPYCVGGGDAGVARCAACRTSTDCGAAQPICRPENVCGCNANSDCPTAYCDPVTHQCSAPPDLLPAPDMAVQLPDMGEGRDLSASADDAGATPPPPPPGCGCVLTGDATPLAVIPLALLALALVLRRRVRSG